MDDSMCGHSRGQGVRYDQEICGECSCSWAEPDCARDSGDAPPSPDVEETETHVVLAQWPMRWAVFFRSSSETSLPMSLNRVVRTFWMKCDTALCPVW